MAQLAIEARGLEKSYSDVEALAGLDLDVRTGMVLGLLGPNGAGKTTAVRILATLLPATAGTARVAGFDVVADADEVRGRIGLTGQYAAVDEFLTGAENLTMIGRLNGLARDDAGRRAQQLLGRFGLDDAGDRTAKTYSGGMRRRLDLAASLVLRPQILFLDEPTTGLDPASRRALWAVIREVIADGATVLLTTQYLEEADALVDEIVVIDHGTAIAQGTSDQLKAQVGGQRIELTTAVPEDASRAAGLLGGLASEHASVDDAKGTVAFPADDGGEAVAEVVRILDGADIVLADLSLRRASLDDVFLSLTGRTAASGPDELEAAR